VWLPAWLAEQIFRSCLFRFPNEDHHKHARADEILEVLALLAEGTQINPITRVV
jgi:hypothetical protein